MAHWLIVDDETPGVGCGKGWRFLHNANGGQVGEGSHYPPGSSGWSAKLKKGTRGLGDPVYPFPAKEKGRYVLMGRVPYQHSADMNSRTVMEIVSEGKMVRFDVNQAVGMGEWRKLGEFDIAPGATLRIIASESYGVVIADGFALVPGTVD